ncbi:Arabinanase/levansucrase/invertase [Mollisia scopiformis]|uniref:Arabinanase/levansucrase/invertase n=1 Tax=Mollisia scopiformis TaxID=149040 RepID=A0A194XLE6_MOLSC|nr:Arabinanase/levansucrase/invertase [Mollisia scopiformis]KUJ20909.1 Arabinanase/levansucrase/invertase [Mollisia scopiformis]
MWSSGIVHILVILSSVISHVSAASQVSATFSNAVQYQFDTDGNAIDLTSGKIDFLGSAYVWYGLPFGCGTAFCGVATYSSPDLQTWHYNGLIVDPSDPTIAALCLAPNSGNCGRPHIVYSAANNDYVLWVNAGSPGYVLFTSSSPISGFVQDPNRALIGFQPPGSFQGGDFSVHVVNGTGYLAYSLIDFTTTGASIWPPFNQSIYAQQLTPDMRNTTGPAYHVVSAANDLVDFEAESPDIFKRGDYFYISASNTCGFCTGTLLIFYRSKSLAGPWTRQIISADTCGGQSTGVLTLPSPTAGGLTSYLHIADLVATAPLTGTRTAAHGHQIQLLNFNADGSLQDLDCSLSKSVGVTFIPGTNVSTTGLATSATDSSEAGAYSPSCNLPQFQLYQTWASSKTGILSEVGVNLAGDFPTGNTTITIFRYQNNTNFFTPHFVWETLTTYNVVPANVSQALEVVRVPVNAAVSTGDRLGMALVTASVTPLCTLVMNSAQLMFDLSTSTRTLFANGPGQVSLRGINGNTPPVVVLPGQELKWYATVN